MASYQTKVVKRWVWFWIVATILFILMFLWGVYSLLTDKPHVGGISTYTMISRIITYVSGALAIATLIVLILVVNFDSEAQMKKRANISMIIIWVQIGLEIIAVLLFIFMGEKAIYNSVNKMSEHHKDAKNVKRIAHALIIIAYVFVGISCGVMTILNTLYLFSIKKLNQNNNHDRPSGDINYFNNYGNYDPNSINHNNQNNNNGNDNQDNSHNNFR